MKAIILTGVGALGLGALLMANSGRSAQAFNSAPPAAVAAPATTAGPTLVNCGEGRQAVLSTRLDGTSQVECVSVRPLGFQNGAQFANQYADVQPLAPAAAPAPVTRTVVQERVVYRDRPVYRSAARRSSTTRTTSGEYRTSRTRSWKKSAAIIGGSTAAGAGVGAVLGGKSGAKKGAVVGLVGSTVYDIATRTKKN